MTNDYTTTSSSSTTPPTMDTILDDLRAIKARMPKLSKPRADAIYMLDHEWHKLKQTLEPRTVVDDRQIMTTVLMGIPVFLARTRADLFLLMAEHMMQGKRVACFIEGQLIVFDNTADLIKRMKETHHYDPSTTTGPQP